MRIGFIVHRKPFLKVLGPLISRSIEQGHEATLLFRLGTTDSEKSYQNVDAGYLANTFGSGCEYISFAPDNLCSKALETELSVLITLEGYYHASNQGYLEELERIKRAGVKLVSLSHFFEFMLRPIEALDIFDQTIYLSKYQVDLHFDLLGDESGDMQKNYKNKYSALSSPLFDLITTQDSESARRKFNIPQGKKVVLLMSPILTSATPWRHRIWRESSKLKSSVQSLKAKQLRDLPEIWFGKTFKDSVNALRTFCDQEDALLIVKSRGKHTDPDYLIEAADLFIGGMDDDFFPHFTTYGLLAIADFCITVMSMTALEAAISQTPVVNIYVPHLDFEETIPKNYLSYIDLLMSDRHPGIMNYPSCVNLVHYNDFPEWILQQNPSTIPWDGQARKEYTSRFLGVTDKTSTERILLKIENSL